MSALKLYRVSYDIIDWVIATDSEHALEVWRDYQRNTAGLTEDELAEVEPVEITQEPDEKVITLNSDDYEPEELSAAEWAKRGPIGFFASTEW